MKRIKLRTKFVILLITISLAPLILTALLTFVRFQGVLEKDAVRLENQLISTAVVEIKSFVISQIQILDTVAMLYNPDFSSDSGASKRMVENMLYRSENFIDIAIVDKYGQEIERQNRILVITKKDLKNVTDTPAFKAVKQNGIYVGTLYIEGGKPYFDLGRWVIDSQGAFSGVVFAQVDAKTMPQVMTEISAIAGLGGRVYMVDTKGIVVAHPDLSYILGKKNLSLLPPIDNIISGNSDVETPKTYYNEKNEYVLGSARPIRIELTDIRLPGQYQINWFVVAELQRRAVFAEAYKLALFFILISLMVIVLAVVVAFFFARRVSIPVEALYTAALEFGKGNLDYRAKILTNDEMGDLAGSFNNMAGELTSSINRLREEEKVISAERNKLSIILSGITNAVIAVDLEKNIILFNKAAETLTGLKMDEVVGKSIKEIIKVFDKDKELLADEYCPIKKDGFEGVVFQKNNLKLTSGKVQERYVNLMAGTIHEGLSVQLGCILTFQDITREFVLEKMKIEFVSIAAHQLRTPLTGIKWSLHHILSGEDGKLSASLKKVTSNAFNATNSMINLINDLLDVSRIEEGRFGVRLEKQSITPFLKRLNDIFKDDAKKKDISFNVEIPATPVMLNIDSEKIEIVLNNLVDNAIKYSLAGGSVDVKIKSQDQQFIIAVKDTGIVISEHDFDRIFTKFFRSEEAKLYHTDGSGLGLYVSKNIIDQHGGKIWFDSKEKEGTTFYISLPIIFI